MKADLIITVVLILLVVALFAISYMKKKKYNTNLNQLREELKPGDKVMTDSGIVGEVVDSYVEEDYKYFVLKSGKGDNVGYYTVHGNAIYYVFGKDVRTMNEAPVEKVVVKVAPKTEDVKTEETNNDKE